jgi:hypothetical protein
MADKSKAKERHAGRVPYKSDMVGTALTERGYRARGAPIRFCETNPFYFRTFFEASFLYTTTYAVCRSVCKWVRSGKTNPFSGGK